MSNADIFAAEYIWLDGAKPTQQLRSKTKLVHIRGEPMLEHFPRWTYDGSSTEQSTSKDSDCNLMPVYFMKHPLRDRSFIVIAEVYAGNGQPHETNQRIILRKYLDKYQEAFDPYIGFEQEYTFFDGRSPLGWPENGFPAPQGPFYCGVGAGKVFGRDMVDAHILACLDIGIAIFGVNAEVMPGQWEFQIGFRGVPGEKADPLTMCDHLWVARYLIQLIAEKQNVIVSFDNKPIKGDWNGAGLHTNFSTKQTRDTTDGKGMDVINDVIEHSLLPHHTEDVRFYGANLELRLTGQHETESIDNFTYGVSNRGASVRIPLNTAQNGGGYFEDRRPGANADPYVVAYRLMRAVVERSK